MRRRRLSIRGHGRALAVGQGSVGGGSGVRRRVGSGDPSGQKGVRLPGGLESVVATNREDYDPSDRD